MINLKIFKYKTMKNKKKKNKNKNIKSKRSYIEMKTESILSLISSPESKYKRNPSLKIDYKIDTDLKYEVNNLINIKKISKPDFEKN